MQFAENIGNLTTHRIQEPWPMAQAAGGTASPEASAAGESTATV